jgi:CheY-like chemotaxis protein
VELEGLPPLPLVSGARLRGMKVAYITESVHARNHFLSVVNEWELILKTYATYHQMLSEYASFRPECVLLDIPSQGAGVLPPLTGVTVPVIIASWSGMESLPKNRLTGDRVVVPKPLKRESLHRAFAKVRTGSPMDAPQEQVMAVNMGQAPVSRLGSSILLVEDNPDNQHTALATLRHLGMTADVACNGREALAALNRKHYDVLLMDVHMPDMDGLEATRRIRKFYNRGSQPRIIAMTASCMEEDIEAMCKAGMDDIIGKPFLIEDLERSILGPKQEAKSREEGNGGDA